MRHLYHSSLTATLALLSCLASTSSANNSDDSRLNFLAIGDWGGEGAISNLLSMGGLFYPVHQKGVAAGMARVAQNLNASFVVGLGDNFYMSGIGGDHPFDRVSQTFEDVYHFPSLQIPWYVIAGNHDHYGNVTAQLEYTQYSRAKSQSDPKFVHRWKFPSLYHKQSIQRGNLTVDLILIDTILLEEALPTFWNTWMPESYTGHQQKIEASQQQWKWLEKALKESTADYTLVGGHFPVFNQGAHGPTPNLVDHLKPLLDKYQAHYLAGHDHAMMHFQTQNSSEKRTNGANYIVTGTGNSCCSWRRGKYKKQHERDHPDVPLKWHMFYQDNLPSLAVKGGFVSLQATLEDLRVNYHDQEGKVLFQADPILPRTVDEVTDGNASEIRSSSLEEEEDVIVE